jgi:hypothetical protein
MPDFTSYVEVEPYEFVSECSKSEIKELIDELIDAGHLPQTVRNTTEVRRGNLEEEFLEKMNKLSESYYRISQEDDKILQDLFKKYL